MRILNIQQAKTHLSRLVEDAVAGEEIVIAKSGKPRVRLTPCAPESTPRVLGRLRGRVRMADDFDDEDSRIVRMFEDSRLFPVTPRRPGRRR